MLATSQGRSALRLHDARRAAGMTRAELADAMSVDRGTVRRWEEGEAAPHGLDRMTLADVLGVGIFVLWPPAEVADGLTIAQRRIVLRRPLANASIEISRDERHHASRLFDLWVAEDEGSGYVANVRRNARTIRLTRHGLDVADSLRSDRRDR